MPKTPKLAYIEFTSELLLTFLKRETNIPKDASVHRINYDIRSDSFKLLFESNSLDEEFRTSEAEVVSMFEVIFHV